MVDDDMKELEKIITNAVKEKQDKLREEIKDLNQQILEVKLRSLEAKILSYRQFLKFPDDVKAYDDYFGITSQKSGLVT